MKPLYKELARLIDARLRCEQQANTEWFEKHTETIQQLVKAHMPSGSGLDCGTKLDLDASKPQKLVFHAPFHHMNEGGMYDGWTDHTYTVTPCLMFGLKIKISGRDRNQIKEMLHEEFNCALSTDIEVKGGAQ